MRLQLTKNARRVVRLADRLTLVLMYVDAADGTLCPFDDKSFWTSGVAKEMREMPFYNEVKDKVREMVA